MKPFIVSSVANSHPKISPIKTSDRSGFPITGGRLSISTFTLPLFSRETSTLASVILSSFNIPFASPLRPFGFPTNHDAAIYMIVHHITAHM